MHVLAVSDFTLDEYGFRQTQGCSPDQEIMCNKGDKESRGWSLVATLKMSEEGMSLNCTLADTELSIGRLKRDISETVFISFKLPDEQDYDEPPDEDGQLLTGVG